MDAFQIGRRGHSIKAWVSLRNVPATGAGAVAVVGPAELAAAAVAGAEGPGAFLTSVGAA